MRSAPSIPEDNFLVAVEEINAGGKLFENVFARHPHE